MIDSDLVLFVLQLFVVLGTARLLGSAIRLIGQPQVVGEILAGIVLGPSFLGWLMPTVSANLFPRHSLALLSAVSHLGLILFMFAVGLRIDVQRLKRVRGVAIATSAASILLPFIGGVIVALYFRKQFPGPANGTLPFALFMGTAMSITAFPVLVRILTAQDLLKSTIGVVAITCASVDDVSAWVFLAAISSLVHQQLAIPSFVASVLLYGAFMILVLRPLARRLPNSGENLVTVALLAMLASACVTEWIGIHALFGAFFAGAILSTEHGCSDGFARSAELFTSSLLLPVFFALTGLRMSIGAINQSNLWGWAFLIIGVAVVGKIGGTFLGAKAMGLTYRESLAIGVLLNTRGLVELVVLNIGLDLNILDPAIYTIMVLMAVTTTLMTTPLLRYVMKYN